VKIQYIKDFSSYATSVLKLAVNADDATD